MIDNAALEKFCQQLAEKKAAFWLVKGFKHAPPPVFSFEPGKKYARIVEADGNNGKIRNAWCFVDLSNGNILKAAGWSAPAKGPRGNIANGVEDVGDYGPHYLR